MADDTQMSADELRRRLLVDGLEQIANQRKQKCQTTLDCLATALNKFEPNSTTDDPAIREFMAALHDCFGRVVHEALNVFQSMESQLTEVGSKNATVVLLTAATRSFVLILGLSTELKSLDIDAFLAHVKQQYLATVAAVARAQIDAQEQDTKYTEEESK